MLDAFYEKENSFRSPIEFRMDSLLQLNIPYALAMLDAFIPALEAADAGQKAAAAVIDHAAITTPDFIPEWMLAEQVVKDAEEITAEAARIENTSVQPEAVSAPSGGGTALKTRAETKAAGNLIIDQDQARRAQEATETIAKIYEV
jgi:hypothetical protein